MASTAESCSYAYDGQNNRLQATRNGQITRYIYSASGNLIAEADQNNKIQKYYIHGLGLLSMVTPSDSDKVYCYHYNATGNTIAMTDASQQIVNKYSYSPFGIIANQQEAVPQPFKYVGQYGVMTEPNGLQYMRARYYDPEVGRFISEDPIGFAGGDVNLYVYVGNNPLLFIDPWGLCSKQGFLDYAKAVGGGAAEGFYMAGKVVLLTKTFVAVKAYALFDVATGGPVTTAAVGTVLTNPQGSLDVVTSMFPGTTPVMNWSGVYGATAGKILETDKW